MFCTKCGNKLADDARFCTKCGTAVNKPSVPSTPYPTGTFGGVTPDQSKAPPQQQIKSRKKLPLKPFIIAGASLIVIAAVLMSILVFSNDVDVYAWGRDEDDNPVYWKNGKPVELPNGEDVEVNSMFVSDNDVYFCGNMGEQFHRMAIYWKNGKLVELSDDADADAESIYVSGNDVYICGWADDKAVYWKNGKLIELSDDAGAESIYVSGNDVYVCGKVDSKPVYWKNGKLVELSIMNYNKYNVFVESIYVSSNDVYVSGCSSMGKWYDTKAIYWKNGKLVELPKTSDRDGDGDFTKSIYVSGKDVYVCGSNRLRINKPFYWKNGKLVELPKMNDDSASIITESIYISRNNVYVGGVYYNEDTSKNYIVLWKNNKIVRSYEVGHVYDVFVTKK